MTENFCNFHTVSLKLRNSQSCSGAAFCATVPFFPHYIVFTDDENIAMPEMLGMLSIIYWVVKTLRMNATSCDERTSRAASTFAGLPQISTLGEASGGTYGLEATVWKL